MRTNKTHISLLTILLFSLVCKAQPEKPNTNESINDKNLTKVQSVLIDGSAVEGYMDYSYKTFNQKELYPYFLEIVIKLDNNGLQKNKLPKSDEAMVAIKIKDTCLLNVKSLAKVQYLGYLFYIGEMHIFIYSDVQEKVAYQLPPCLQQYHFIRKWKMDISEDASWENVQGFLK